MTGAEHYREAEKLIAENAAAATEAQKLIDKGALVPTAVMDQIRAGLALQLQLAQVHATLALAAATALGRDAADSYDDYGRPR